MRCLHQALFVLLLPAALRYSAFSCCAQQSGAVSADSPDICFARLTARVDQLLQREQPPLFAWHLRSIRALAESEHSKLSVQVPQSGRQSVASRAKEFVEYVSTIELGLRTACANPDAYLKDGRRTLILGRPSRLDGSLQYMMVSLPKSWDANRAYPLFVGLHGSGPDNPLAYPSFGFAPQTPPAADTRQKPGGDMIGLNPWGRGNRSWRGDAETDLFEAIELLKTFCKLDPERWYITGHSSGADGCWAILQHTPDLWAAAGIQSGSMLNGRPEWGLIPNMQYVPVHFLIGEKDPLPYRIPDTKEAHRILSAAGDDTKLVILPGIGHYPLTEEGLNEQTAWMVSHVRKRPDRFSFTVDQAIHPGVWGITVPHNARFDRLIKEPWPNFECEIQGCDVRIKTMNIKELGVELGPTGLCMAGNVRVFVNGKLVHNGPVPTTPIELKDL